MTVGDRYRTRVPLLGVPTGTICTVRSVWEPATGTCGDIECRIGDWVTLHTVWASELEALPDASC